MAVAFEAFEPIFIVGAPRSGTSLLRAMLNRHPRIGLCDETFFFYYVYNRQHAFGNLHNPDNRSRLVRSYLRTHRIRSLQLDLSALAHRLMEEATTYDLFFAILLLHFAQEHGKVRPGEKTPHHALVTHHLLSVYQRSRVIHIVRDPRDVAASMRRMPWGQRSAVANARQWVQLTAAAERSHTHPRYRRIHYERLIAEPEVEMRQIAEFLGESYDDAMIHADGKATAAEEWFQRAQQDLTAQRIGLWHKELTADDVRLVEWIAGPTMSAVGYDRVQSSPSLVGKVRGLFHAFTDRTRQRIAQLPAHWYHWVQPTALQTEEFWIDRSARTASRDG